MAKDTEPLTVLTLQTQEIDFLVRGTSPLVYNAMSEKARLQLLVPRQRKTIAERSLSAKHEPMSEYRASVYQTPMDDEGPTRLSFPSVAFKRAIAAAALDLPGMRKTQIGRLVRVLDHHVPIYGTPQIYMAVVRSADIKRTPDIRTRAILKEWCCRLTVQYVTPLMRDVQVGQLLAAAGILVGVGDGRQEKGALSFGLFDLVSHDDPAAVKLMASAGKDAQDRALASPAPFDVETERLLALYHSEMTRQKSEPIGRKRNKTSTQEHMNVAQ